MREDLELQRHRLVRFVVDTYDDAVVDGTTELEMTITVRPRYEKFEVRKEGVIRRVVEDGDRETD